MNKILAAFVMISMLASCAGSRQAFKQGITFDKQGHRGARGLSPENTIPSMLEAIDLGVTTLEMDVVISKDRQVVVSHDPHFHEHITTLPDGKLLNKQEAATHLLYNMNYDSISKYDVGMKPHPDFVQQKKMAVSKPLMTDLIRACEAHAKLKGRKIYYNIEVKSKPENDGKKHPPIEEFIDLVMAAVRSVGVEKRINIQSFDPRALQIVHRKYPSIVTAFLIEGNDKRTVEEQLQQLGYTPEAYSPHYSLVNSALVQKCREKGMKLIPWTVNKIEDIRRLKELGVDGIITDYPNLFAEL